MNYAPLLMRTEDREYGTYGLGWIVLVPNKNQPGHRYKTVFVRVGLSREEAVVELKRAKERGWLVE